MIKNAMTHEIFVRTKQGRERMQAQYASVHDVMHDLCLCRSAAYEYMSRVRRFTVYDGRRKYYVIERRFVGALPRYPAGNPNFKSRSYQRELARRPRKGKVLTR